MLKSAPCAQKLAPRRTAGSPRKISPLLHRPTNLLIGYHAPMNQPLVPCVGSVLSADIAVPDHERELRFYSRVLTTGAQPLWQDDLMNCHGVPIIGLGAVTPDTAQLPRQWMPHIQVADVAASVKRAVESGGRELMHHQDTSGNSQWAVLQDPNGAAFGIIPVVPAEALPNASAQSTTGPSEGPGRIAWLDLTVNSAQATADFYQQVVGWSSKTVAMNDAGESYTDFELFTENGTSIAGVCHARGPNQGLPAAWLLYLPVGDLGASLKRVEDEGGKILRATQGDSGKYNIAIIEDPGGVCFALTQQ